MEVAREIGTLVAGIGSLSTDMSMLTINARIEAARWGSQGAAFGVIASGMRELTGEVQRVNSKVGDLATSLSSLASRLVENDDAVRALGANLKSDVTGRVEELHGAYGAAQRSALSAASVGSQLASRIAEFSSATLTNLQFQDRMAQTFREIDAFVGRSRAFTEEVLVLVEKNPEDGDVDDAIEEARARAGSGIVRISHESELLLVRSHDAVRRRGALLGGCRAIARHGHFCSTESSPRGVGTPKNHASFGAGRRVPPRDGKG